MEKDKNYYEILEVNTDASVEELKQKFRVLMKKYHPDTYNGDKEFAKEYCVKITEAYTTLKNPVSREKYNSLLKTIETKKSTENQTSKEEKVYKKEKKDGKEIKQQDAEVEGEKNETLAETDNAKEKKKLQFSKEDITKLCLDCVIISLLIIVILLLIFGN